MKTLKMKTIDLYESFLKSAKISISENIEVLGNNNYKNIVEEFTISNKQGFFINSLMVKNPFSKIDKQIIYQDNNTSIILVFPPHYIKFNGFFTIRKITTIKL